jgi:hypothetical protein
MTELDLKTAWSQGACYAVIATHSDQERLRSQK